LLPASCYGRCHKLLLPLLLLPLAGASALAERGVAAEAVGAAAAAELLEALQSGAAVDDW
jgi:hypothetical protein